MNRCSIKTPYPPAQRQRFPLTPAQAARTMTPVLYLVLLMGAGCGKAESRADVQGKVTLDGTPLVGVVVTFYPMTETLEGLPFSRGTTDKSGIYTLAGADGTSGALVGKCRVVVNWPPRERDDSKPAPKQQNPSIPLKYTVAKDTPLEFEVKAGTSNKIDLPLLK
jgi:hypothetical protein